MKKAGQQIAAVLGLAAAPRISGPRRFEARGQAGRSGDARRWLVRAAPGLGGRNRYRQ